MLNSARRTDEMCGAADGIRHGAAAVRRNTVSAAYIRCRSSKQQTTVAARCQDHGSTARLTCGAASKTALSRKNGTFGMRDIPENPHKRRDFAAGKRTSDTSLIIIHQKKDVCQYRRRRIFPFGDSGGAFFVPEARAGRGRYTRQRSAYRNKRKRAAADMPHRGVEKVYAPNAPGCAKIRFPYHKHRTRRIGGTKFHPRKRGYNICEQPRFSRMNSVVLTT